MSKVHISGLLSDLSDSFSFSLYLSLFLCSFLFLSVVMSKRGAFSFFGLFCCVLFFFRETLTSSSRVSSSSLSRITFWTKQNFFGVWSVLTRRGKRESHLPENHPSADFNITHTHTLSLSLSRRNAKHTCDDFERRREYIISSSITHQ